jgi:hypothetical protein
MNNSDSRADNKRISDYILYFTSSAIFNQPTNQPTCMQMCFGKIDRVRAIAINEITWILTVRGQKTAAFSTRRHYFIRL